MDILSIAGLVIAVLSILGGQIIEGGHVSSLINAPAFAIVVGGSIGAILLQTPIPILKRASRQAIWVFLPPKIPMEETINKIIEWGNIARKEGLLGLENLVEGEPDPFAAKALQLLVDGSEPEDFRHALETELNAREDIANQAAKLFEGMGGYAPTIGIIGAVLGLIHVMENLADPSKLGPGIASAFVATIYGVGVANLVMIPVANKLKSIVHRQSQLGELLIEGMVAIAQGENPRRIESRLQGFVQH
jgi:chemotaxis protein MotA